MAKGEEKTECKSVNQNQADLIKKKTKTRKHEQKSHKIHNKSNSDIHFRLRIFNCT